MVYLGLLQATNTERAMSFQEVFHFDEDRPGFDDWSNENGNTFWWASDLSKMLGYASPASFRKTIDRAITSCTNAGVNVFDNFQQAQREVGGSTKTDFKLSRFACYLTAMNADPKKEEVARAQAYFVTIADSLGQYLREAENVERLIIRKEVTDHEKSLSSTAKSAGVQNFAFFKNAGYMGMYNMTLNRLKERKGIPQSRSPLDFMGKTELAANLFRITQTEERIKAHNIKGQRNLENTARAVGKKVRQSMEEISGTTPEHLPPAEDIKKVRTKLKKTDRQFKKLDN